MLDDRALLTLDLVKSIIFYYLEEEKKNTILY